MKTGQGNLSFSLSKLIRLHMFNSGSLHKHKHGEGFQGGPTDYTICKDALINCPITFSSPTGIISYCEKKNCKLASYSTLATGMIWNYLTLQWPLSWLLHKWRGGYLLRTWAHKITLPMFWLNAPIMAGWSIQSKCRQSYSPSSIL